MGLRNISRQPVQGTRSSNSRSRENTIEGLTRAEADQLDVTELVEIIPASA